METKCEDDTVASTLEILRKGENEIRLTNNTEAVLLIGHSGHGKSTLAYFLAGNNSQLISHEGQYPGSYIIKDCHDKIGPGIISRTLIPDLVEEERGASFYDNPGFRDTRCVCAEIANSYFMDMVASNLTRIKLALVFNRNDLFYTRDGFIMLLRNTISFVPNIYAYGPGLSLILTKAHFPDYPEDEIVANSCDQLQLIRNCLALGSCSNAVFQLDELDKMVFILDSFLANSCSKVAIFRTPNACGFVSDIDILKQNREIIKMVLEEQVQYVEIEGEFGATLSADAREAVRNISQAMHVDLLVSLSEFAEGVKSQLESNCSDYPSCEKLNSTLSILFQNVDFKDKYTSIDFCQSSPDMVVTRLVNSLNVPGIEIPKSLIQRMETTARHLAFLETLVENLNIDKERWLEVMLTVNAHVKLVLDEAFGRLEPAVHELIRHICYEASEQRFHNKSESFPVEHELSHVEYTLYDCRQAIMWTDLKNLQWIT